MHDLKICKVEFNTKYEHRFFIQEDRRKELLKNKTFLYDSILNYSQSGH
jgi:hypothetical protein